MGLEAPTISEVESERLPRGATQPWPKPALAWYSVAVFAVVLMLGEIERNAIRFLIEPIERDFHLHDWKISILVGVAPSIFYALVGVPMARLVDSMRRNLILSIAVAIGAVTTSISGLAQTFWQFAVCRVLVGGGGAINGPGTYSMMADYFPRPKLPRAIAILQIGYISGNGLANVFGGLLVGLVAAWPVMHVAGLAIRNWQMVFVMAGGLGVLASLLLLTVREPARRGRAIQEPGQTMTLAQVAGYLWKYKALYAPQFLALAFSAVETYGNESWRIVFLRRTYGWGPQLSGVVLGFSAIGAQLLGLIVGTWLTERLARTRDDANLRAVAIFYSITPIFAVIGPLMPNPWLSVVCSSLTGMCGLAGAVPQNAALQSVTPNEMRGQVTALYLFVFAVIGVGIGPTFMALITDFIVRDEFKIRYAMAGSAAIMTPLAAIIMWSGVKAYGRAIGEVKAREALGHG